MLAGNKHMSQGFQEVGGPSLARCSRLHDFTFQWPVLLLESLMGTSSAFWTPYIQLEQTQTIFICNPCISSVSTEIFKR